jgi:hypothetical protein
LISKPFNELFSLVIYFLGFLLCLKSQINIMYPLKSLAKKVFDLVPKYFKIFKHSFDLRKFDFSTEYKFDCSSSIKIILFLILYNLSNIMSNEIMIAIMLSAGYSIRITLATEFTHIVMAKL